MLLRKVPKTYVVAPDPKNMLLPHVPKTHVVALMFLHILFYRLWLRGASGVSSPGTTTRAGSQGPASWGGPEDTFPDRAQTPLSPLCREGMPPPLQPGRQGSSLSPVSTSSSPAQNTNQGQL